jgi:hypothetical protein
MVEEVYASIADWNLALESYDVGCLRRLPFWESRMCACECVIECDSAHSHKKTRIKILYPRHNTPTIVALLRNIHGLNIEEKDAQLDARSVTTSLHFLLGSADTQTQTLDNLGHQLPISDITQHGILEHRNTGRLDFILGVPSSGSDAKCFATMAEVQIARHVACQKAANIGRKRFYDYNKRRKSFFPTVRT